MYRTFVFLFFALAALIPANAQSRKYHFTALKMGSPFNLIFISDDSLRAAAIAEKAYALVDSFNHLYSDYDTSSELNHINIHAAKAPCKLSPALFNIIVSSQLAWQKSDGTYDITVGALSQLWRKARKEKMFPDSGTVRETRKLTGFSKLQLDTNKHTIYMAPGMRIDLGGIAKGSVAQEVIGFLKRNGITQALADAGGDMVMSDAPPDSNGWTVGINVPETTDELIPRRLLLHNRAVATSGDAYQFIEHDGTRYSHIIDPRTGYGTSSQRNTTVIAGNGADADWLATACSILPVASAKKLAETLHAELLITEVKDGKIIYHMTKGFPKYWKR